MINNQVTIDKGKLINYFPSNYNIADLPVPDKYLQTILFKNVKQPKQAKPQGQHCAALLQILPPSIVNLVYKVLQDTKFDPVDYTAAAIYYICSSTKGPKKLPNMEINGLKQRITLDFIYSYCSPSQTTISKRTNEIILFYNYNPELATSLTP